jgi:hypothetical protein
MTAPPPQSHNPTPSSQIFHREASQRCLSVTRQCVVGHTLLIPQCRDLQKYPWISLEGRPLLPTRATTLRGYSSVSAGESSHAAHRRLPLQPGHSHALQPRRSKGFLISRASTGPPNPATATGEMNTLRTPRLTSPSTWARSPDRPVPNGGSRRRPDQPGPAVEPQRAGTWRHGYGHRPRRSSRARHWSIEMLQPEPAADVHTGRIRAINTLAASFYRLDHLHDGGRSRTDMDSDCGTLQSAWRWVGSRRLRTARTRSRL